MVRHDGAVPMTCEKWWKDGAPDRADAPAVIERDTATDIIICEEWWSDGTLHRTDGPAVIERDPVTGIVTREDWWTDGSLHRTDGPAIIERDPATGAVTCEEWWIEEDFAAPSPAEPAPATEPPAGQKSEASQRPKKKKGLGPIPALDGTGIGGSLKAGIRTGGTSAPG
jgi:hypothetical protein